MRWAAIKLLRAGITMWLVVTFVFFVLRLSGDPTYTLLPDDIDESTRDFYRRLWGLDQPLFTQYWSYLKALMQGDFGISFRNNQDAFQLVWDRVPKTALLGGTAIAIAIFVGIPAGILAALYRDSWIDRTVMAVAVFGFSMPNFFLGILLILFFSLNLRVLPSSGSDTWWHLVMPAATLGISFRRADRPLHALFDDRCPVETLYAHRPLERGRPRPAREPPRAAQCLDPCCHAAGHQGG